LPLTMREVSQSSFTDERTILIDHGSKSAVLFDRTLLSRFPICYFVKLGFRFVLIQMIKHGGVLFRGLKETTECDETQHYSEASCDLPEKTGSILTCTLNE
jgi:hypothetical protein